MTPDRFTQMVEACTEQAEELIGPYVEPGRVVALLRRQHAAYVRLVEKAMGHHMGAYVMLEDPGKMWISRTDLLAAFTRYRQGTP